MSKRESKIQISKSKLLELKKAVDEYKEEIKKLKEKLSLPMNYY